MGPPKTLPKTKILVNLKCNLPTIIEAYDYHAFDVIEKALKQLNPKIQVEETNFYLHRYHAIVYLEENEAYKKLKHQDAQLAEDYEETSQY